MIYTTAVTVEFPVTAEYTYENGDIVIQGVYMDEGTDLTSHLGDMQKGDIEEQIRMVIEQEGISENID